MNQYARACIFLFGLLTILSFFDKEPFWWAGVFSSAAVFSYLMYKRVYFLYLYLAATVMYFLPFVEFFPSIYLAENWFNPPKGKGLLNDALPIERDFAGWLCYGFIFITMTMFMFHINRREAIKSTHGPTKRYY